MIIIFMFDFIEKQSKGHLLSEVLKIQNYFFWV